MALVALDAVVRTIGPDGTRTIPIESFFLRPGDTPSVEHPLAHGELIVAIDVPDLPVARTSRYVKHRDRASYEFALVSVFSAMRVDDAGNVAEVRLALGGVGTVPWRAHRAEEALIGRPATAGELRGRRRRGTGRRRHPADERVQGDVRQAGDRPGAAAR